MTTEFQRIVYAIVLSAIVGLVYLFLFGFFDEKQPLNEDPDLPDKRFDIIVRLVWTVRSFEQTTSFIYNNH
jgi:hypothetical protein